MASTSTIYCPSKDFVPTRGFEVSPCIPVMIVDSRPFRRRTLSIWSRFCDAASTVGAATAPVSPGKIISGTLGGLKILPRLPIIVNWDGILRTLRSIDIFQSIIAVSGSLPIGPIPGIFIPALKLIGDQLRCLFLFIPHAIDLNADAGWDAQSWASRSE